jgi:hypothetical protein
MAHLHIALLDSSGVVRRQGIAWQASDTAFRLQLNKMLEDGRGRMYRVLSVASVIQEQDCYIGTLEDGSAQRLADSEHPIFAAYKRYPPCKKDDVVCAKEQQEAIAVAQANRKRPSKYAKQRRNREAVERMDKRIAAWASKVPLPVKSYRCEVCNCELRELESGETTRTGKRCWDCARGSSRDLSATQTFISKRIMGEAFKTNDKKATRERWQASLYESGHKDKPDSAQR